MAFIQYIQVRSMWYLLTAGLLLCMNGHAQFQRETTHNFVNNAFFNPAEVGSNNGLSLFANYRGQWIGIEGAPQEQLIAADLTISRIKSGVGFVLFNEFVGAFRSTTFKLQYAFLQKIGNNFSLSSGLGIALRQASLDGSKLTTPSSNDGLPNDPNLLAEKQGSFGFGIDLGFFLKGKGLEVGVAVINLTDLPLRFDGEEVGLETSNGRSLNLTTSYKIDINRKLAITPMLDLNTDFKKSQMQLHALFNYNDWFDAGISFRGYNSSSIDALIPVIGFQPLKSMNFYYSYEISLNSLRNSTSGTHEISFKYEIPESRFFKGGKVIYNPRFL